MNRRIMFVFTMLLTATGIFLHANTPPTVSSVSASQRTDGSKIVDIWYSVNDADGDTLTVSVALSNDNGNTFGITPSPANLSGAVGENILSGTNKHIIWNAGAEGIAFDGSQYKVKVTATEKLNLSYGLVAYYPFNGNANDESGNGANGTTTLVGLVADRFGNPNSSYSFIGWGSRITSHPALPIGNAPRCVSAWFNTTSTSGSGGWNHNTIYSWGSVTSNALFSASIYEGIICFSSFGVSDFYVYEFLSDGLWHNLALSFDGSSMSVYIDGDYIEEHNISLNTAMSNLYIGARVGQSNQFMAGYIDDVRIYNRALTVSEIQALYHEGGWIGNP